MGHRFDDIRLDDLRRRRSAKWLNYPPDVIPAFVAEMDFPADPNLTAAVQRAVDDSDFGYAPYAAMAGFPEAVAKWQSTSFAWDVDPRLVVAIPDVVRGLEIGVRMATAPGEAVIVTPPIYPPFLLTPPGLNRSRADVPMIETEGGWRLDWEGLDRAMADGARTMIFCHPHNPAGRAWTLAELDGVIDLAVRHNATIISDEIHAPLTYPPALHVPLASRSAAAAQHTLTVTSTSKAWNIPGLKCAAAICGSAEQLRIVNDLPRRTRTGVGNLGMTAMMAAMEGGQPWLAEVLEYLDANRRFLAEALSAAVPGARFAPPEATYLGWVDCTALDLPTDPHKFFVEHARVAFSPGSDFGDAYGNWVRFNFATARPILEQIVQRMADALARR